MKNNLLYSVVIPVYNSGNIVSTTIEEVINFFIKEKLKFEIILVNDGSKDNSWEVISKISNTNSNIIAINLLKNYGQHNAIFCGLKYTNGDYIITMDDDMQNPPSEINHLINKALEGYDLVFGQYEQKQHSIFKKLTSKLYNYVVKKIFDVPDGITISNFKIFHKSVVNRITSYKTLYPYISGLGLMYASNICMVNVIHNKREVGSSTYTLFKMLKMMATVTFNYSTYPLKFLGFLGFFISLLSFSIGLFYMIRNIIYNDGLVGWTSLVVLISFLGGYMIMMIGIIGDYIGRILLQQSTGSTYEIKETLGCKNERV